MDEGAEEPPMIPNAVGRSGPQPAGAGPAVMTKREPWMTRPCTRRQTSYR